MKKIIGFIITIMLNLVMLTGCRCDLNILVVYTESGFEPFEYISKGKIQGVDVEIMDMVGEKLGMKVQFEDVPFNTIIDAVSQGKLTHVGAAGISITEARKEKVDFSMEYYQADLYAIYAKDKKVNCKVMSDGEIGVYWEDLSTNKGIGVQTGTTADLFLSDEIKEGGSLYGVRSSGYDKLTTACSDIGLNIDYVIIDKLPAQKLVEANNKLACIPIYYSGEVDKKVYDTYAICVTKGKTEILNAINEVLAELLVEDEYGVNEIERMVNKHLKVE